MMRIEPLVEALDRASLAGAVDPGNQHDHRKVCAFHRLSLRREQRLAQLGLLLLEGGLVQDMAQLGGFKHRIITQR